MGNPLNGKGLTNEAAPPYRKELDESGYHYTLQYEPAKHIEKLKTQQIKSSGTTPVLA